MRPLALAGIMFCLFEQSVFAVRHSVGKAISLMDEDGAQSIKVLTNETFEEDSLLEVNARPPAVDGLLKTSLALLAQKEAAAQEAYEAAQKEMFNLSNARSRRNNTAKRDSSHAAVDAMFAANADKLALHEIIGEIEKFVEACKVLFGGVKLFLMSRSHILKKKEEIEAETEAKRSALASRVVDEEKLDLANLMRIIKEIMAQKENVVNFDARVVETIKKPTGAVVAITASIEIVLRLEKQLSARNREISSDKFVSLDAMRERAFPEARMDAQGAGTASLGAAQAIIDRALSENEGNLRAAQAELNRIMGAQRRGNASNAAAEAKQKINEMTAMNDLKFDAEDLRNSIDRCLELVSSFFDALDAYQSGHEERAVAAVIAIKKADTGSRWKRANIYANQLKQVAALYDFYLVIWRHYFDIHAAIPELPAGCEDVVVAVNDVMKRVHEWVNEELAPSLGPNYRQDLQQYFSSAMNQKGSTLMCDERSGAGIDVCLKQGNGRQPNGKFCKWIWADAKKGLRSACEVVRPWTDRCGSDCKVSFEKYTRTSEPAGIFY
jgi:hypothetical protein